MTKLNALDFVSKIKGMSAYLRDKITIEDIMPLILQLPGDFGQVSTSQTDIKLAELQGSLETIKTETVNNSK